VVQRYNGQHGTKITLTNEAFDAISAYEWPGNVRELLNRLNRALIVAGGERITPADLELAGRDQAPTIFDLRTARERVERAVIIKALEKNGGNISRAAVDLGTSRPTLHHLLNKYEITAREYTRA